MFDKPFPEALQHLLEQRGISTRQLSERSHAVNDGWGSQSMISLYLTGKQPPTPKAIERLARALDVEPEVFAEYRLSLARAQLDPDQVGLKLALNNLARSGL